MFRFCIIVADAGGNEINRRGQIVKPILPLKDGDFGLIGQVLDETLPDVKFQTPAGVHWQLMKLNWMKFGSTSHCLVWYPGVKSTLLLMID
jgi:hypothetical protein